MIHAHPLGEASGPDRLAFSSRRHCARCDREYREPVPNLFSFNSPIGACPTCHGCGRTIEIDYDLVIPDPRRSLKAGAIKPWTYPAFAECQRELLTFSAGRKIPVDRPWSDLPREPMFVPLVKSLFAELTRYEALQHSANVRHPGVRESRGIGCH